MHKCVYTHTHTHTHTHTYTLNTHTHTHLLDGILTGVDEFVIEIVGRFQGL